jgi:hypothetical protein
MKKYTLSLLSALLVIFLSSNVALAFFDASTQSGCPAGQAYYNADGYTNSNGEYIKNYSGCGTGNAFTCTDGTMVTVPNFYLPLNEYKFYQLCPTPTTKIPAVMISVATGEYLTSQTEGTANITIPKSAEGKVIIFSSKSYINWVISNPDNITPAKIVLIATMNVNTQGNVDIAHHQRLTGDVPTVPIEKPYVIYAGPDRDTYFLKKGYTISQEDTYTAERAGDLPKSISPNGTPFGDKITPTTRKETCSDGRKIDVPYSAGSNEVASLCKGVTYVDFNKQFLGPNGLDFKSYVVDSTSPIDGYQRTYEAYDFLGDGQMKKFYERRTLEAVKVGWGNVSIGDTLPMKIEARGANSCEVTSSDGLRIVPPAIEDSSWKVVPATGKISSYDPNLVYSNYVEYVEVGEISGKQQNGLGYRALYTTPAIKSPSTTFTVTCWFPPSISWDQYKAARSSIGVNTLNKNTAIAVSKAVLVNATPATVSGSVVRATLDTYRIYNPQVVKETTGSDPNGWDLRANLLSYVHTVIRNEVPDSEGRADYTPRQFTEQEAYAWCKTPRSDTDYLMCFWNNKLIYAKDKTGAIDLTNVSQKSRVSNMPTLTHNGVVYGKQTSSDVGTTPSSSQSISTLPSGCTPSTVYSPTTGVRCISSSSGAGSSSNRTPDGSYSLGSQTDSSAGTTSNPPSTTKAIYRQYYGTALKQYRARVTRAQAVTLCNTRVAYVEGRATSGKTTESDISKVRCTWGSEQIYPTVTASLWLPTGEPAVLGAFTSAMCADIAYNVHRGAESPSVSLLQSFLLEKGFMEGEVTGFYGDKTVEAVKDYQASVGLPTTGMVYDFTREAIRAESCR